MAKGKTGLQTAGGGFSNYKFDTSKYLVLDFGVSRDIKTGQLVAVAAKSEKPKK